MISEGVMEAFVGKRKPSSPQQSSRQIRFTMRMPSTPSSEYSCTPEKKQKKSDDMELDAAAPGMDGDSMTGPGPFLSRSAPVARPLFPSSAFGTAGSVKVLATKEAPTDLLQRGTCPHQAETETAQNLLPAAGQDRLKATFEASPHQAESEAAETRLPPAPENLQATSEASPHQAESEAAETLLPPAPENLQATSQPSPHQAESEAAETLLPPAPENMQATSEAASPDPLEQQEAADSEQMQKKPLPPLPDDLKVALEELGAFLDVPDYIAEQKAKTLGIFGPKA